jgi:flagellar basal-body rod protein FlgC
MSSIFDIASSAMNAQMVRLNTTASNLANVDTVSTTEEGAYRARNPIFQAAMVAAGATPGGAQSGQLPGVLVKEIAHNEGPVPMRYEPTNPMANEEGYVFGSNVNAVEEMANMISASRSYQSNMEVFNTTKTLMLRTLQLGQQ